VAGSVCAVAYFSFVYVLKFSFLGVVIIVAVAFVLFSCGRCKTLFFLMKNVLNTL